MASCLPGLENKPDFDRDVFRKVRGEIKVKRKLSVGLVLTILLLLTVAGAVAAVILSLQQIVEEQAIPMANQYEGERYSIEDMDILLTLADENGIILSEQTKEKINRARAQGEGYFKEELLMAFAKAEFGEEPSAWTLEEQKWFDDVCVAIGFIPEGEKALPTGNVISQEEAIRKAQVYIQEHYDTKVDLMDEKVYQLGIQYINGKTDGTYDGNYWTIHYKPLTLDAVEYWLNMNDTGDVWNTLVTLGVADGANYLEVKNRYEALFGWDFTIWDHAVLQSFQGAVQKCGAPLYPMQQALLQTEYPDIAPDAISGQRAAELGAQSEGILHAPVLSMVYIGSSPNPVWKITYQVDLDDDRCAYCFVEVDSMTGQVLSGVEEVGAPMYRSIVLDRVYEGVRNWEPDLPSVG